MPTAIRFLYKGEQLNLNYFLTFLKTFCFGHNIFSGIRISFSVDEDGIYVIELILKHFTMKFDMKAPKETKSVTKLEKLQFFFFVFLKISYFFIDC